MNTPLATIDEVLGAVLLISALVGLWRGLFREVFSLVIWIGALVASWLYAGFVGDTVLAGVVATPLLRSTLGFGAVFLAVLIAGSLVSRMASGLIASAGLSATDRVLGAGFGLARGAVIAIIAVVLLRPVFEVSDWWATSYAVRGVDAVQEFLATEPATHDDGYDGDGDAADPGQPQEESI